MQIYNVTYMEWDSETVDVKPINIVYTFDNVKDVDLSETEVAPMKKEIMIEQRAVVKLADNSERRTRMTFFVTLDFNSLCDSIEYWYGMRERS